MSKIKSIRSHPRFYNLKLTKYLVSSSIIIAHSWHWSPIKSSRHIYLIYGKIDLKLLEDWKIAKLDLINNKRNSWRDNRRNSWITKIKITLVVFTWECSTMTVQYCYGTVALPSQKMHHEGKNGNVKVPPRFLKKITNTLKKSWICKVGKIFSNFFSMFWEM